MKRDLIIQFILLAIIAGIAFVIITATQVNLERLGVVSEIDFLWKRAGFEIGQTLISYDANSSIARAFFVALLNTLLLALTSIICASLLGLIIGVSRLSPNWLLSHIAVAYVELFRNIPALLQVFFWYFVVLRSLPRSQESYSFLNLFYLNNRGFFFPAPIVENGALIFVIITLLFIWLFKHRTLKKRRKSSALSNPVLLLAAALVFIVTLFFAIDWEIPETGRYNYHGGFVLMPEFMALVVGLSMYNATYISEIVRSAFTSVSQGQTEAAASLGLSTYMTLRLIIFPQALRVMIPPLATVYVNLFKSTSLAAAIAYPEIVSVFVGTVNNLVGQPVIIMMLTLAFYSFISFSIAAFLNWYNNRISLSTGNRS